VRVGLAFAKGLRLATRAEILGFSTLDCMAAQAAVHGADSVGAVIDAKRGEVYVQAFSQSAEPLGAAAVLPVGEASGMLRRVLKPKLVLIGSGASLLDGFGDAEIVAFYRIDTALLAQRAASADPARYPAVPAYLRAPDARLPA
jgi:tRNA threonylcarbamoyladenosine biosynthesis protein TsaB